MHRGRLELQDGEYEIELRRWPEESGKPLTDSYDGKLKAGEVPVAKVDCRSVSLTRPLSQNRDQGVLFSMRLNQGKTTLTGSNTNEGWPPLPYLKQENVVAHIPDAPSQALLCEAVTSAAIDFISRHKDEPFFAYVPHAFVHLPRLTEKQRAGRAGGDVTRAQIEEVDDSVGQILATIKELGIAENTLVFFTSDNGPAKGCSAGPLRGHKGGPKYEGHMRVPTLAWWPGKIQANSVCSEIGTTTDILSTLAKLTGGSVPSDRVIDGEDISSLLFESGAKSPHDVLFYGFEGVWKRKWKLVYPKPNAKPELYKLDADLSEKRDLAAQHPEQVDELSVLLKDHEKRVMQATRPAGKADNPVPILSEPGDLPTLAEYLGRADIKTAGQVHK